MALVDKNKAALDEVSATYSDLKTRYAEADQRRKRALELQQDLRRAAEAEEEHRHASAAKQVFEDTLKLLKAAQTTAIEDLFQVLLEDANYFANGILKSPLVLEKGEIGRREGLRFIPHQAFSGTEEAIAYIAIAAGLSRRLKFRLAMLDELRPLGGRWLFPGEVSGRHLSNMAMLEMCKPHLVTVHGFRSSFRDWAGEVTDHPREIIEAALAHVVGDRTERAYRRGDPLKAVVWKRVAQAMARGSDDLVSRDHASAQQTHELWLDWAHTGTADTELRASRLTAWVLQAERLGMPYGLRLPGREFPPHLGGPHRLQCLEALALC